ncbi:Hypothetical protein, putative [Bodo saltans]|uniref:Uncharacterized protein n=1 Tax=Bodo saltans TaxID=75058 RepID=A0A0S4IW78_BODSA|nr:Hypothetical protein, putative [Bodo saltans]|eukprot:CUF27514.1 Hypothetical protein, putative [Bodo saltans]
MTLSIKDSTRGGSRVNVGASGLTSDSSTQGANSFNASVRRVGGDSMLINASFVNTSMETVLAAVGQWAKDLMKFPRKASPIDLYLQSYTALHQGTATTCTCWCWWVCQEGFTDLPFEVQVLPCTVLRQLFRLG